MKKISFTLLALIAIFSASAQHRATFDDLGLGVDTFWNGSNLSGGFLDGDAYFLNQYDTTYQYWSGSFVYSSKVDVDTIAGHYAHDYDNEHAFSSAAGGGVFGSRAFSVFYSNGGTTAIRLQGLAPGHQVLGTYITNNMYAYLSMRDSDFSGKKFGGATGRDPDWFKLTIGGWYQGAVISNNVDVYLADFRSLDTTQHYILHDWKFVNLQSLGNVDSLFFTFASSDTGMYGINTPTYFAADDFITTDGVSFRSPVAVNDFDSFIYTDTTTGGIDTAVIYILANDTFSSYLTHTVKIISGPQIVGATAYLDSNNNLVYIPVIGLESVDSVTYILCDETGNCAIAQVYLNIEGISSGITEISTADLHLSPNPATTSVSISSSYLIASASIMDMSDREVMAQDINRHSSTLDIAALSAGVYTVMIHTTGGVAVRRLIRQ